MIKFVNFSGQLANTVFKVSCLSGNILRSFSTQIVEKATQINSVNVAYEVHDYALSKNTQLSPILILHSLMGCKENWGEMSRSIHERTGRKVVIFDARNHGSSPHSNEATYQHMIEDIVALMQTLDIPKITLVGHSMGGRTAMLTALSRPELISSLIVVDVSPFYTSPGIFLLNKLFDVVNVMEFPKGITFPQARKVVDETIMGMSVDISIKHFMINNLSHSESKGYYWRMNLPVLSKHLTSHLIPFEKNLGNKQYGGPTLFIGGGHSEHMRKDELPQLKILFPKAEMIYIEDGGHWVHKTNPPEFLEIASTFLNQH